MSEPQQAGSRPHRRGVTRVQGAPNHGFGDTPRIVARRRRHQGAPGVVAAITKAWRVDHARIDVADMNAWPLHQLAAQRLGQAAQAELARRIGHGVGLRDPAAHRERIDQHPATLLLEVGQYRMRAAQVAEQIGLHHLLVGLQRRFVEGADGTDTGVVDPDVDAPMAELRRGRGQPLDLVGDANVGRHHQGVGTFATAFSGDFLQGLAVARRQDNARALPGESLGRGAADAAGGAGDHHHGAVE